MRPEAASLLAHLTAASQRRVAAIVSGTPGKRDHGLGTGTILRHRGNLFVLTCKHVADDLLAAKEGWLNFFKTDRLSEEIRRADTQLVHSDVGLDVALLKIASRAAGRLEHTLPITIDDLGNRGDFLRARRVEIQAPRYAVCGFSREFARYARRDLITMQPTAYGTFPCEEQEPNQLMLLYSEEESGKPLPDAVGQSGSLIWELAPERPGELWVPGKAVAMQHAWTEGKRLICSPIYGLRSWIAKRAR